MGACQACDVTNEMRQQKARLHVAFVQLFVNCDFYVLRHSTFLLESPLSGRKRRYCMLLNARGILSIEKQTNPHFVGRSYRCGRSSVGAEGVANLETRGHKARGYEHL